MLLALALDGGGHARASYSPFTNNPNRNELNLVESHTSDGNDQPSSCGVHGDGATSQSSLIIDGAASAAPQSDVTSSSACSASPRASAKYGSTLVQPYSADARVMHPDSCERNCGAAPCAPAASPHMGRALSASAAASRLSEESVGDKPLIDFSDVSFPSKSASVINGGAALSQLREAAPPMMTDADCEIDETSEKSIRGLSSTDSSDRREAAAEADSARPM